MIGDDSIIQDFRGISRNSNRRRLFNFCVFRNAGLDRPNEPVDIVDKNLLDNEGARDTAVMRLHLFK